MTLTFLKAQITKILPEKAVLWGYALAKAIYLHIVLGFFTLPLLLHWGLPFSPYALLGNLIFAPLLSLLLLLASLLFFTEILHIPNTAVAYLFDSLAHLWDKTLTFSLGSALNFAYPGVICSCLALGAGALGVHLRSLNLFFRLAYLASLLACFCSYIHYFYAPPPPKSPFSKLTITAVHKTLLFIDRGTYVQASRTWPSLEPCNPFFTHYILIFLKPTLSSLRLVQLFLTTAPQSTLILPQIYGNGKLADTVEQLKLWCKDRQHKLFIIEKSTTLTFKPNVQLHITVQGTLARTKHITQVLFTLEHMGYLGSPVLTQREQALLQRQSKQAEGT